MTVPVYVIVVAVAAMLAVTYLAASATSRYLHWRSRARQLHGALEGCSKDLQQATGELRQVAKERDFYRDAARSNGGLRERLGLVEGQRPKMRGGRPAGGGKGNGLHVPGRS